MTSRSLALLGLVAVHACLPVGDPLSQAARRLSAVEFVEPYLLPLAALTNQHGETIDLTGVTEDRITLLFFGYTSCPDICPLTMATAARAVDLLEEDVKPHVGVVFISLDAKRDDPERIRTWLDGFDSTFVGLTGTQETLDGVLEGFGFVMPPTEIPETGDYEVPHPATLFVFTPDRFGRFGYGLGAASAEQIAEDLRILNNVWWPDDR